ncbi:MAG: prephenate dehydrogenase/arogenate dehydrogenase family protein [Candidatus Omnitrophota bacterium]
MKSFKKIAIIGVGLLGGSIGMAIKQKKIATHVTGFFRDRNKIKKALSLKAIDQGTESLDIAVENADLIILCTPVYDIVEKLKCFKRMNLGDTLITDIGSTKKDILNAAKGLNFIGSHPLAGSEQSGIENAQAGLFKDSVSILTPSNTKQTDALKKIHLFWQQIGAKTTTLSAASHDKFLAYSSHLPHALACSLIKSIPQKALTYGAGGLKDTTRIALAETHMWADIFLSNKEEVLKAFSAFEKNTASFKKALIDENRNHLCTFLRKSLYQRKKLSKTGKPDGKKS